MIFINTDDSEFAASFDEILGRGKMDMEHVGSIVGGIIKEIQTDKNSALKKHIAKFDNWTPVTDEDLKIEAIIGILDFERVNTQPIIAQCKIKYIKYNEQFINYAEVALLIEKMLVTQKYALIEDALEEIIEAIIKKFKPIKSVKLKLSKPKILDNCIVSVEAFRKI